jgi:flavin-dependent dehydrogenase
MSERHEIAVIGGGLAGSGFAIALAEAGRDVVLVEREAGPHDKVCGEFLSGEALFYLQALGVDPRALGAVPIETVLLSRGRFSARRRLPFPAASLSRRRLDEAMLQRASEAGVRVLRGSAVRELRRAGPIWRLGLADGLALSAAEVALATGKHDLRGHARPPGRQNDLIGLKAHFRLRPDAAAELEGCVQLGLFPGGYAGLEPIEDGLANLCMVVRTSIYARHGRDWAALLAEVSTAAPALGALLDGAEQRQDRPLAVARIPYGLVRRSGDDLWRLGDQAAVIPSFSGEGMSIALHSARLAATTLLQGGDSRTFQERLAAELRGQVGLATLLSQAFVHDGAQLAIAAAARLAPRTIAGVAAATRLRFIGHAPAA